MICAWKYQILHLKPTSESNNTDMRKRLIDKNERRKHEIESTRPTWMKSVRCMMPKYEALPFKWANARKVTSSNGGMLPEYPGEGKEIAPTNYEATTPYEISSRYEV